MFICLGIIIFTVIASSYRSLAMYLTLHFTTAHFLLYIQSSTRIDSTKILHGCRHACTCTPHNHSMYIVCSACKCGTSRTVQLEWTLLCTCLDFQVNCCWFPGVAPFSVGHLSGFMAHVHKSQRTSSVCLTVKKWKGSTIQTRDSLCVSHRGSKRQGVSSSHSHSHPNLERSRHTQASFLLVSSYSEPHSMNDCVWLISAGYNYVPDT